MTLTLCCFGAMAGIVAYVAFNGDHDESGFDLLTGALVCAVAWPVILLASLTLTCWYLNGELGDRREARLKAKRAEAEKRRVEVMG